MKRIGIGASLGAVVLALAACGSSDSGGSSADYPSRDIRMVISYAAGGPTDIAGRGIAKYLSEKFGVSVPVENLDGASGSAGTLEVVNAKADGYTIGVTTASAVSRVPLIQDVGYTMDDVVPIGVVTDLPGIIFVPTDSPYETIEDLFEAAKANPNKVTVGAAGAQTPQAVELERLKTEYDVPLQVVPFQGDGPAVTALIGGQVDAAIPTYSSATKAQYDSGAIRSCRRRHRGSRLRQGGRPDAGGGGLRQDRLRILDLHADRPQGHSGRGDRHARGRRGRGREGP